MRLTIVTIFFCLLLTAAHLLEAVAIQGNLEEVLIFEKALPSDVAIVDWLNLIENVIQKGMRDDVRKCLVETNRGTVMCDYMIIIIRLFSLKIRVRSLKISNRTVVV